MPSVGYSEFDSLGDVLLQDRFEVLIEPAGQQGTNRMLALRCQQIVIPDVTIEPVLLQMHGFEFSYRGRRTYDKSLAATFIEMTDGQVGGRIRAWMEQVVGSESHNGASKRQYATVGTINVLDQSGLPVIGFQVDNLWPQQIPQIQLDGSNASPFQLQATFTFDRLRQNGVTLL